MRGGDGAGTDVPIAPRDASDGRLSGLVESLTDHANIALFNCLFSIFVFEKDLVRLAPFP